VADERPEAKKQKPQAQEKSDKIFKIKVWTKHNFFLTGWGFASCP
jgi:hypothetical protein